MRMTSSILLILFPFAASAIDYQNMGQADMQAMMKNMEKMQNCMENIDQDELNKLQARSEEFTASIKSLCHKGMRAEAQDKAVSYSKKFANEKVMKDMKKCGDMAKGMMPPDSSMMFAREELDQENGGHVCDSIDD